MYQQRILRRLSNVLNNRSVLSIQIRHQHCVNPANHQYNKNITNNTLVSQSIKLYRNPTAIYLSTRFVSTGSSSTSTPSSPATDSIWSIGANNSFNQSPKELTQHVTTFSPVQATNAAVDVTNELIDDRWTITQYLCTPVENLLCTIHETTGLPWWATIISVTLAVRVLMIPIGVAQARAGAASQLMRPELDALNAKYKQLQASRDSGMTTAERQQQMKQMQQLMAKYNFSFGKMLLAPVIMAPTFIIFFSSLRYMCVRFHDTMSIGGTAWFNDLTALDPYYGLPAISAITTILAIRLGAGEFVETDQSRVTKKLFMIIAPIGAVISAFFMPAAVFLYWCTSNICTFLLGRALANHSIRKLLNIPIVPKQVSPSESLAQQFTDTMAKVLPTSIAPKLTPPEPVTLYTRKPRAPKQSQQITQTQTKRTFVSTAHYYRTPTQYTKLTR